MSVRWKTFQTAVIGFRMLGYPRHWYAVPVLHLAKGLAPVPLVRLFRAWQGRSRPPGRGERA